MTIPATMPTRCPRRACRRGARSSAARIAGGRAVSTSTSRAARIRTTSPPRRARRAGLLHGAGDRQARHPRPDDRQVRGDSARPQLGAARRGRRPRRRAVDHRWRPERDRARRLRRRAPCACGRCPPTSNTQPQHADLRREGPRLVHRPERLLRPARSRDRRHEGVEGAARPRPLRHHDDAVAATSTTRRSPATTSRASTPRPATRRVIEPPTPRQGARRVWSDSRGRHLGQLLEHRAGRHVRPRAKAWREWTLPGDSPRAYSVWVDDADKVWLTEWTANAIVRFDPVTEKFESFPSNRCGARTCARCSAARARRGAPNRAPTASS